MISVKYKYVFFDFDGTLADTESINLNILSKLSKKYKIKSITREELRHVKKMSALEAMDYLGIKKRKVPFMLRRGKKLLNQDIVNVKQCQDTMFEVIRKLKEEGIKVAIITTNSKKNVKIFLEQHDAEIFDFIMSSTMFGKEGKLKKIIKKEKINPDDVLYVGDEIRDIHAAQSSHIGIASVAWGYNTADSLIKYKPDYLIYKPEELISICI